MDNEIPILLPVPDDFPFEWEKPSENRMSWVNDRLHFAGQYTPLAGWYMRYQFGPGMDAGRTIARGTPMVGHMRRINTFMYYSEDFAGDEPTPPKASPETEEQRDESIRQFGQSWQNEWLPEIKANHKTWKEFDLAGATVQELLTHLEWSLNTVERHYIIHGELLRPGLFATILLEELYTDLFEDAGSLDVFQLTQGFENSSTLMGWDLYDLSEQAAKSTDVLSVLDRFPPIAVLGELKKSDAGAQFAKQLKAFLDLWGNRAESTMEIGDPTWSEDPTPVINNIKTYISSDGEHPRDRWNVLVAAREKRVSEVRAFLADYPEQIKRKFEELLAAGQLSNQVIEDHNWWIDQMTPANIRHVFMEFGRRFTTAGTIEKPEDIFMLDGDEIVQAAESESVVDLLPTVNERILEMERWESYDPPIKLGKKTEAPPESDKTRPSNFYGATSADELREMPGFITGSPASTGKIIGTARVITKLNEAGRLAPGEILVTVSTLPPWTPLFATAGGVVTDAGGTLSHAAIVAREYGLPALVGTVVGTKTIKDGQQIEVNGDEGTVRLLD